MNMRRHWWIFVAAPAGMALFAWIGGEIVKQLWNWLLPPLFGWPQVTFWQAIGILALCRILFGRWGGGSSPRSRAGNRMRERMRERWAERWETMTPEERERYRQRGRGWFRGFEPPDESPSA